MPKISMAIPHSLTTDEAVQRLRTRFEELMQEHGEQIDDFESQWQDSSITYGFKTYGVHVKGAVTVELEQVQVDTELPMLAMMFKGMIQQRIHSELSRALA